MYRVLVVDDEEFIANSLAYMLEAATEFKLDVYKAYSGYGALEYMQRVSFDLLIADIQMPGMLGIELLQRVKEQWPLCHVIFLSGHDEFEYAQKAMQYNADDYVLKNQGDAALLEAVRRCIGEIEREEHNEALLSRAEEQMKLYMPLLRRNYWQSALQNGFRTEGQRAESFARFDVRLDPIEPVLLLAARPDDIGSEDNATSVDVVLRDRLGHVARAEICCVEEAFMLWAVQPLQGQTLGRAAQTVKGMCEAIQRICHQTLGISVSLVINSEPVAWEELPERCRAMRFAVVNLLDKRSGMAIVDMAYFGSGREMPVDRTSLTKVQEALNGVAWAMSDGDAPKLQESMAELSETLGPLRQENGLFAQTMLRQLDGVLLNYIVSHDLQSAMANEPLLHEYFENQQWSEPRGRIGLFLTVAKRLMQLWAAEQSGKSEAFVGGLDTYILQNPDADLSLVALSERVYLNPSYLSRRYKELTGRNISDMVTSARMRRAAQLLADPQYKIRVIAEKVGYQSAAHFTRLFKKESGMTPQEYRDSLGTKEVKNEQA